MMRAAHACYLGCFQCPLRGVPCSGHNSHCVRDLTLPERARPHSRKHAGSKAHGLKGTKAQRECIYLPGMHPTLANVQNRQRAYCSSTWPCQVAGSPSSPPNKIHVILSTQTHIQTCNKPTLDLRTCSSSTETYASHMRPNRHTQGHLTALTHAPEIRWILSLGLRTCGSSVTFLNHAIPSSDAKRSTAGTWNASSPTGHTLRMLQCRHSCSRTSAAGSEALPRLWRLMHSLG